ncbi:hypothetical protein F4780DRAFT_722148 [Xylariomycetidae sp. FL0641]|nr:hypothetical protein F4780DRAFT_722148 [Xylariomycetidae sp. FL0641]
MLYRRNAKVYMTARDQGKATLAINDIKKAAPSSTGALVYLKLDLSDLASVKASAEAFLEKEDKLHVHGRRRATRSTAAPTVHYPGAFLFTRLLTPTLVATAKRADTPPNTMRVVFLSSLSVELYGEKNVGIDMANLDYRVAAKDAKYRYGISKLGSWAYAVEFAARHRADGVAGVAVNPGNIRSDLSRSQNALFRALTYPANYPVVYGAYPQLWAGLSPNVAAGVRERMSSRLDDLGR